MDTIVWSRDFCPYCDIAKDLLKTYDIAFEERNLSKPEWTREDLFEMVPDAKTVPQVFVNGRYVGGAAQLREYLDQSDIGKTV